MMCASNKSTVATSCQHLYFGQLYIKNGTSYGAQTCTSVLLKVYRFIQYTYHVWEHASVQLFVLSSEHWCFRTLTLGACSSAVTHRSDMNLWLQTSVGLRSDLDVMSWHHTIVSDKAYCLKIDRLLHSSTVVWWYVNNVCICSEHLILVGWIAWY